MPLWIARGVGTQMAGPELATLAIGGVQRSLTQSQSGQWLRCTASFPAAGLQGPGSIRWSIRRDTNSACSEGGGKQTTMCDSTAGPRRDAQICTRPSLAVVIVAASSQQTAGLRIRNRGALTTSFVLFQVRLRYPSIQEF